MIHAQTGDFLKEAKGLFTLTPSVKHHRNSAEIHAVGGHEQKVRGNAIHFRHEHANPHCSLGYFDFEQLFNGE